jgi:hypothetical protein
VQVDQRVVLGSEYTSDPLHTPRRYGSWAIPNMMRSGSIVVLPDILAAAKRLVIQPRTLHGTVELAASASS